MELGPQCGPAGEGADRVYAVDVPPGKELYVSVYIQYYPTISLHLVKGTASSCDVEPLSCLDGAVVYHHNSVTWLNSSASSERVFIVVVSHYVSSYGCSMLVRFDDP